MAGHKVTSKICADESCDQQIKTTYWHSVKAHDAGWFFQKDGTAWCPKHTPDWATAWRKRAAERKAAEARQHK